MIGVKGYIREFSAAMLQGIGYMAIYLAVFTVFAVAAWQIVYLTADLSIRLPGHRPIVSESLFVTARVEGLEVTETLVSGKYTGLHGTFRVEHQRNLSKELYDYTHTNQEF